MANSKTSELRARKHSIVGSKRPVGVAKETLAEEALRVLDEAPGLGSSHSSVDETQASIVDFFCKHAPDKALELGVDVLNEVVETTTSMAEKGAVALAEIEARGERIERLNEDNKQLLAALIAG